MDYAALKNEIQNDPTGKGYALHLPDSPGHVVELLNAQTETMIKPLRSSTAKAWAATGPYAAIVDASNTVGHPCRASCLVLRDAFASGDTIYIDMPDMQAMFAGWVLAVLITQSQHDALMALATQPASRAEIVGLQGITEADVLVTIREM
jgi:hypothetical protein